MTTSHIHEVDAEAMFTVFGVKLRCYILDDGTRIINAEDLAGLFRAIASGNLSYNMGDLVKFARWQRGELP